MVDTTTHEFTQLLIYVAIILIILLFLNSSTCRPSRNKVKKSSKKQPTNLSKFHSVIEYND